MKASTFKKYNKYSLQKLIEICQRHCNKYIRLRDKKKPCLSCGKYTTLEAGHYYSAGHYSMLRFDEDNIWGQCSRCNRHLHGNLIEYRKGLVSRIGEEGIKALDNKQAAYKAMNFKWDRIDIIEKIEYFKEAIK